METLNYDFVDIHAHMSDAVFKDKLQNMMEKLGRYLVFNAGESPQDNDKILLQAGRYPNLLPCIGLHPNHISVSTEIEISAGVEYIADNISRAEAVSEVGLDYKGKEQRDIDLQKRALEKILEIAERNKKPCILHSRKAIKDILDMLGSFHVHAIIHNFEGNKSDCSTAAERGIYMSISTGFMKFRKDSIIRAVPPEQMFVETDSPVLSPDDSINTPENIPRLLDYISVVKRMDKEALMARIMENLKEVMYD
ncbi:TatD family hydrolase [Candidatus Parvarchaeota archaeon]|nr:TatD family hydrolase [Candidatus Parvarchaeota archaeon]